MDADVAGELARSASLVASRAFGSFLRGTQGLLATASSITFSETTPKPSTAAAGATGATLQKVPGSQPTTPANAAGSEKSSSTAPWSGSLSRSGLVRANEAAADLQGELLFLNWASLFLHSPHLTLSRLDLCLRVYEQSACFNCLYCHTGGETSDPTAAPRSAHMGWCLSCLTSWGGMQGDSYTVLCAAICVVVAGEVLSPGAAVVSPSAASQHCSAAASVFSEPLGGAAGDDAEGLGEDEDDPELSAYLQVGWLLGWFRRW